VTITVDANVLVYASNTADPAHPTARALVERLAAGPELVYLFWPTLMGYLRIVTHPALPRPLTPAEEAGFSELYRATAGDHARGNHVPDAHLAALMRQHGVRVMYSRDRGFRRFDFIEAATRSPEPPGA